MARKRRAALGKFEFDAPIAIHLGCGSCLLAGEGRGCGCGMVDEAGIFNEALAAHFRRQYPAEVAAAANGAPAVEIDRMLARRE